MCFLDVRRYCISMSKNDVMEFSCVVVHVVKFHIYRVENQPPGKLSSCSRPGGMARKLQVGIIFSVKLERFLCQMPKESLN